MKKFLLATMILVAGLFITGLQAQAFQVVIKGTITDDVTGVPIANHDVYIMTDSASPVFVYYNVVQTDNNGFYKDVVPIPPNMQILFFISTLDCNGNFVFANGVSTNSPIINDFVICGNSGVQCNAHFQKVPDSLNPLAFNFIDMSTPLPDTWAWEFGDGSTSSAQNPYHVYSSPGIYQVCLSITTGTPGTANFCQDTYCKDIIVDTISVNCHNDYLYIVNNMNVEFYGIAFPPNSAFSWDFGDGNTDAGQNVSHTYQAPGMYNVSLTTTTTSGCTFTSIKVVDIVGSSACDPMFTAMHVPPGNGTFEFIDMSLGAPVSWLWEFGDGNSSSVQNPIHTYNAPGNYLVCLTIVCDPNGTTATYCDSVVVTGNPGGCTAMFDVVNDSLNVMGYYFVDMSQPIPDTWLWDFGDGSTSTSQNPFHAYNAPGKYHVCLTITTGIPGTTTFCQDTYCHNVFVDTMPTPCHNGFQFFVNNLTVTFFGAATPPNSVFTWDFGDGNSGAGPTVTHTYAAPGQYTVTLTTFDSMTGCLYTSSKLIDISGTILCDPMFQIVPNSPNNMNYHFLDKSNGNPILYFWDFGDGDTSTVKNPNHTYTAPGLYFVCLSIVCDPNMPSVTYCDSLVVTGSNCDNYFVATISNLTVAFEGFTSSTAFTYYSWDFGDGDVGTGQNVTHTYAQPGNYHVCLTTVDSNNCTFTSCQNIHLGTTNCHAMFQYFPDSVVFNYGFHFVDMSMPLPDTWLWEFGDGTTDNTQFPYHVYNAPGVYQVCLTITTGTPGTANFCQDTHCKNVVVDTMANQCHNNFQYSVNGLTVDFYGVAMPQSSVFEWDFGDGNMGTGQNVTHTYAAPGMYTVALMTTDPVTGCTFTSTKTVHVNGAIVCDPMFQVVPNSPNNMNYHFLDKSSGNPISYFWEFGDGGTSTVKNPNYTYTTPGLYLVCLTIVCDPNMPPVTYCDSLMVTGSNCDNYFIATINNLTVAFEGFTSSTVYTYYSWDFGDGDVGTGQNVTHTYAQAGNYNVCLTTVDSNNCTFTSCQNIHLGATNCHAMFHYFPDSVVFNYGFHFIDMSQPLPATWLWEFGDGTTDNTQFPYHVYNAPGVYQVCLTITTGTPGTSNFCQDTHCKNVVVDTMANQCHNNFQYSVNGLTVDFYGVAMPQSSVFEWDFGDGNMGTGQNVTHTYAAAGMYLVTLMTTDPATGCTFTSTKTVHVNSANVCDPMFMITPAPFNNMKFHFTDMSNGFPISWYWEFGDGTHSIKQNPIHTYNAPGMYIVCLTITCDPALPAVTYCDSLIVYPNANGGMIHGSITMGFGFADFAKVFLIVYDSVANTLTAVDTVHTQGANGMMGYYEFLNVQPGKYLVKAALTPNSVAYSDFMPTYFVNTLWWDYATDVFVINNSVKVDINLIAGSNPGGPGFIGGNVTQGANKLLGPGSPIPDVEILLLSMNDEPYLYTYSGVDGDYEFDNLPYGTYKVWAEVMGKATIPAIVTIDAANPTISNIDIVVNTANVSASIEDNISDFVESVSDIYPNPAGDEMNVEISFKLPSEVHLEVFNNVGQKVYSETVKDVSGQQIININTSDLQGGVYNLRITTQDNAQIMRKFVKIN